MTMSAVGIGSFAPAVWTAIRPYVSPTLIVFVLVVAVLGGLTILGWRSPDRPPGADEKAKRDQVED